MNSLESLERAADLDPLSPTVRVSLSAGYSYLGRLEEALREARRTVELEPSYTGGTEYAGRILSKMGRHREAITTLRRVLEELDPSPYLRAWTRAWLAVARLRTGAPSRARELLARIEEDGEYPFMAGVVHTALGEREAAFEDLEASRPDFAETAALRYSPVFSPLREDPRFRELIREVNRHWGLRPDGSLPEDAGAAFDALWPRGGCSSASIPSARRRSPTPPSWSAVGRTSGCSAAWRRGPTRASSTFGASPRAPSTPPRRAWPGASWRAPWRVRTREGALVGSGSPGVGVTRSALPRPRR